MQNYFSIFLYSQYTNCLVQEINDILNERGYISINELIQQFDLPINYIHFVVKNRIVNVRSKKVKYLFST